MEENVALDVTKQKKFDKSIKGIKKLIKKKDAEPKIKEGASEKVKEGKIGKKQPKSRQKGLVYISHIPHGFYEHEMTQYFKQFGVVTNARVIRSKKTGQSKGFAFVEFKEPAVAEIVAETMNNYLMGKRLLKAAYIPPEKQKRKVFRKKWNAINNPGNNLKIKIKKAHNENRDEKGELKRARKLLSNINKTKKKLKELGINYDFFSPVDVPEALINSVQIKEEDEDVKEKMLDVGKSNKKGKKADQQDVSVKTGNPKEVKSKKEKNKSSSKIETMREQNKNITEKNKTKQDKANKNAQKQKKQSLKDKGVTPLEDFIKVREDSDNESENSMEFDSDEYEKMLEGDNSDSDLLEDASDDDDEESVQSEEEEQPKQKGKMKSASKVVSAKQSIKHVNGNRTQRKENGETQPTKRKVLQKPPVAPVSKKPKFEKQSNQKPRNKQFKTKK